MKALLNGIQKILEILTIISIGLMLALIFCQVITRYCFGYTPVFSEELARYLFVWTVFLSIPLLARKGGHMAIETVTSRLHGASLKTFNIIADLLTILFMGLMTWHGVKMVMLAHFQTSPAMMIHMSYVYVVIPVGCFVMLLYTIENLVKVLQTPASEMGKKED